MKRIRRMTVDTPSARRPVVVELDPSGLVTLREKGRRFRVSVTVGQVFIYAMKLEAAARAVEKAAARAARKGKR